MATLDTIVPGDAPAAYPCERISERVYMDARGRLCTPRGDGMVLLRAGIVVMTINDDEYAAQMMRDALLEWAMR